MESFVHRNSTIRSFTFRTFFSAVITASRLLQWLLPLVLTPFFCRCPWQGTTGDWAFRFKPSGLSPYRPSVLSQASYFTALADSPEIQPEVIIPVPDGMSYATNADTKQLQLTVGSMYARRFRRVFGYVWGIQLSAVAKGSVPLPPTFFILLLLFGIFLLTVFRNFFPE